MSLPSSEGNLVAAIIESAFEDAIRPIKKGKDRKVKRFENVKDENGKCIRGKDGTFLRVRKTIVLEGWTQYGGMLNRNSGRLFMESAVFENYCFLIGIDYNRLREEYFSRRDKNIARANERNTKNDIMYE